MTTIIKSATAVTGSLPRARVPALADCLGYYLFGVDAAHDVVNRAPAGGDLVAWGGGPVAHTAATATLTTTGGYQTPFTLTPYAQTICVLRAMPTPNADGSGVQPTGSFTPFSRADGSAPRGFFNGGTEEAYAGSGGGTVSTGGPGLMQYRDQQQFRGLVEDGSTLTLYAEDWAALTRWQATGQPTPARTAQVARVGGLFGTAYCRMASAAFFGRALSAAEIGGVYRVMRADAEARGGRAA